MVQKFDSIIIGAGQAGPSLAKSLCQKGYKVAIIEQAHFGGTCVNTGCTPTKTLVANAKIIQSVRNGKAFGVNIDHFQIDYKTIKARKDAIVKAGTEGVKNSLQSTEGCTVLEGHASFESPNQIKVGNYLIEGDKIFINVGSRSHIPKIEGLEKIPYLTNSSLLDIESIPSHLLILGGGYIGLEFAQIYRRFGSQVTVIQRNPVIMPKEDQDVSEALQKILEKEGIEFYTNALNFEVLPDSQKGHIHAQIEQNGKKQDISGTHLLIATGRIPNTADLGLDKAGVKVDKRGYITVDDQLRTSQPHIWALGDCNGKGAFTHTSYNDYEIVRDNILENGTRKVTDRIPIYGLFTDPPLGRVGLTEQEAQQQHKDVLVAKLPMTAVARAREKGETEGFLKIVVEGKTKQILGASFLGTTCDEVVQLIAAIMSAKAPYSVIEQTVFIHPTVSELIPTLLSKLEKIENTEDYGRQTATSAVPRRSTNT
jgi:pyruvate/2-oxoglutarate dehydrogenase complex dihydrolipoamide dehydrogenase (E3) component